VTRPCTESWVVTTLTGSMPDEPSAASSNASNNSDGKSHFNHGCPLTRNSAIFNVLRYGCFQGNRRGTGGLQEAESDCGAGVRTDEGRLRNSTVFDARVSQSAGRMAVDLPDAQPAQAVPIRLATAGRLRRKKHSIWPRVTLQRGHQRFSRGVGAKSMPARDFGLVGINAAGLLSDRLPVRSSP